MVNVSVVVKGIRLYDPRTVSYVESNNPALILRDIMKRAHVLDASSITDDQIAELADLLEDVVGLNGTLEIKEAANG